jgi:hypothetical protein
MHTTHDSCAIGRTWPNFTDFSALATNCPQVHPIGAALLARRGARETGRGGC